MVKILKDIRVVELGTYITGPAAGMHLADLGADVIKVERPGTGDPFRAFKGGLYSPHYQTYNRNKRSIALDTKDPADLACFTSWSPPPTSSSRISGRASPKSSAPARTTLRKINPR
jgi:crotonobetainyl-CoA:carnitine CoA-transferase CaiB-like acyl-CoA transferase